MADIPKTSVTLLKALAGDSASSRWAEFCRVYEEPMRGFLRVNFPSLEPEDVIQETLLVLVKKLPNYSYTPDERGHFRCYLMGILKHKAIDALRVRAREAQLREDDRLRIEMEYHPAEDTSWRNAAMETAIAQLMTDNSITSSTRQIFEHVALLHESPESVAARFGVTRNNVDQIKARLTKRLAAIVARLTADL